jgi:hypothetical protein
VSSEKKPEARIFFVDTRFQKMARRPGGVSREAAIEAAQTAIEEIQPEIDNGLERELQELAKLIKSAQAGTPEPNWIEIASFQARQIHDVGTTIGAELITFIAESLCDMLDTIHAGAKCNMESIVLHLDALMMARREPYRHMKPEQLPELTQGLRRVTESVSLQPPPPGSK